MLMREMINRRRFVVLTGTAGIVSAAGCIGDDEQSPNEEGQSSGGEETGEEGEDGGAEADDQPEEFEFPAGADESGIVTETVLAGSRQFIDEQDRYRATERYELNYSDAPRDEMETVYDIDEQLVHEQQTRNGVEIDRWVTPDRAVVRSVDPDSDRTSRWQARTLNSTISSGGTFNRYPFEEITIPSLLKSAAFEFDEIVTESEQPYARYVGEINRSESLELRQTKSARVDHRLESVADGSISILLAESGAIRAVEYEFSGVGTRQTHDGREEAGIQASGEVEFEYDDDLDSLAIPEWAETLDSNATRDFGTRETSLGETYKLLEGPSLPGSVEQEYAEFYLTAQFGSQRYTDRYTPRKEFDTRDGVVAWLEDDELQLDWASFSGQDAFVEADRIEMSIYLNSPNKGRSLVFHEEYAP